MIPCANRPAMRAAEVRDGYPWHLSTNVVPAPACSPMGTPLRAALLTGPDILVHKMACAIFSTRDLRPGPCAFASFRPRRPSLARAPRPSAASLAAGRAPSDCSLQRGILPASSLTCTRDPCALSRACLCGQGTPSACRTSACSVAPAPAVGDGHGQASRARSGSAARTWPRAGPSSEERPAMRRTTGRRGWWPGERRC
jgi:hypothetical protein